MANTIVSLLIGPQIPIWVKAIIIAALIMAVLVWWKKAYWEN